MWRVYRYFYPRPPRGGRPFLLKLVYSQNYFYPRPPRGGRRGRPVYGVQVNVFLSTPSARRATLPSSSLFSGRVYFYPRPPRGGRPTAQWAPAWAINFYPRPPRGGRRPPPWRCLRSWYFYPRPPRGGRPGTVRSPPLHRWISIHALREEGDPRTTAFRTTTTPNFYPRPPRGGRPAPASGMEATREFLSTPSARRATLPF